MKSTASEQTPFVVLFFACFPTLLFWLALAYAYANGGHHLDLLLVTAAGLASVGGFFVTLVVAISRRQVAWWAVTAFNCVPLLILITFVIINLLFSASIG